MKKWVCILTVFILTAGIISVEAEAEEWGIPVGGINILMTSVSGEPLERARFQVVRELKEGELTDSAVEKTIVPIGEENRIMAVEQFWAERDMTGERSAAAVTDEQGKAAVYGLTYGTYYLVEKEAPEGFNRITAPIRITVHKYSHLIPEDCVRDDQGKVMDNTLHIVNVRYKLPDTGSWGTLQLAAGGTGILFSSAALLLLNHRRRY